ncbi:MAG: hypothetical protein QGH90_01555 [Candidatus Poseidoniaceae archaeon]|jgi:hypothetical protein|nr:hypothetical protein [Candidatus Poseidoniaceae archaeon]
MAMRNSELTVLWAHLAQIMEDICGDLVKVKDEVGYWRWELPRRPAIGMLPTRPQSPFGAVAAQSKHVGIYLLHVHHDPSIMMGLPPELLARKGGKAMFKFTDENDPAIEFVPQLIHAALDYCIERGYVAKN